MPLGVNITPLIDMSFTMLIFFVVTTRFEQPEGILASRLPRDAGVPTVALPISPIVVRLYRAGESGDDYTVSVDRFDNAPQDFASLPAFLSGIKEQPGFDAETPVVIVADDAIRWDHVVNCWNAAVRAGFERIAFAEP